METGNPLEISIKKEPPETPTEEEDESRSGGPGDNSTTPAVTTAPLRYVSRRGRPPGGGYSMKAPTHYVRFSSTPQNPGSSSSSSGSSDTTSAVSELSPQRLMQLAGSASVSDSLELSRFGIHSGFDVEKNSFRCEGCDVVFSSRDTYAMHMLLRAKNESCVALPTSAISANPENPTPREKFERELRQKAMITALRNQAEAMSKAAAALLPKSLLQDAVMPQSTLPVASSVSPIAHSVKDEVSRLDNRGNVAPNSFVGLAERSLGFNSLLALDAYGLYMDPSQYRRFLTDYGLQASSSAAAISNSALAAMMEQLACGVCGELFSNKDALAMHMMFHTREDDGEELREKLRLREAWMSNVSSMTGASSSMFDPSESALPVSKSSSIQETPRQKSSETNKGSRNREDRQLTAERVAELKRMAIESSLRSSATAQPMRSRTASSQRPRSVTEDSTVTSTAQPRPLSADDARRLATSSSSRRSFDSSNPIRSLSTDARPYRKRHSSNRENYVNSKTYFKNQMSPRKIAKWSYNKLPPTQRLPGNFKVCDNHVSSATGPQDSDENSESPTYGGDVSQANESASYGSDDGNDYYSNGAKGIPYLDAIMSHEAELVPVNGFENEKDNEGSEENRHRETNNIATKNATENRGESSTAIDFSINTQRKVDSEGSSSKHDRWSQDYSTHSFGMQMPNGKTSEPYKSRNGHDDSSGGDTQRRRELQQRSGSPRLFQSPPFSTQPTTPSTGAPAANTFQATPASRVSEARYCPHCEILFLDVTLFHLHMGLHNVNNPWQCNTCGLACSGRLEFNTHVLHY